MSLVLALLVVEHASTFFAALRLFERSREFWDPERCTEKSMLEFIGILFAFQIP
jgi:hypothetical protein